MPTGSKAIERQMRVSRILTQRLGGKSLREIGAAETPAISPQAVFQMVKRVLAERINETVEQARSLELMRLDQLLGAIWQNALNGDIACIDRALAIMMRRARLLGLDLRPANNHAGDDSDSDEEFDPRTLKVEIVGDPEIKRVRWLEERSERLRELEAAGIPIDRTVN